MARFTKVVFAAALVCALCLPAVAAQSATDLTGKHWLQSSQNEKLAFLYGASNIIAIEHLIAQQQGTQASPFVTAWIKAFGNTNWTDIQKKLDAWYAARTAKSLTCFGTNSWFPPASSSAAYLDNPTPEGAIGEVQ